MPPPQRLTRTRNQPYYFPALEASSAVLAQPSRFVYPAIGSGYTPNHAYHRIDRERLIRKSFMDGNGNTIIVRAELCRQRLGKKSPDLLGVSSLLLSTYIRCGLLNGHILH